jgi:ADP-ribosylglycohydrolase
MLGAERAEHGGMHRSALQLYELARPFVELPIVGTRMARAHILLGEWTQADELLDQLPPDAPEVLMLRSDLFFVRGNFDSALREMKEALNAPGADRVETLIRLGGIYLHLGELGTAAEYATEALEGAKHSTAVVRCEGLLGAAAFFGGDIDEGERHFVEAMTVLSAQPSSERDQTVHTMILGNLGQAKEARMQWAAARQLHEEALSVRRTVSDARGELQSLHAVARCEIGTGSIERGLELLEEAVRLASDLGARLEQGKIDHTFAQVELLQGRPTSAVRLAEEALRRFRELGVTYDVAHARFTLATAFGATGAHRREVEEGAKARTEAQSRGFGLLTTLFPQLAFSYRERVEAGLVAYACGDALGLPWEGMQPDRIDPSKILSMPTIGAWPKGGTSDDTALTLLVAEHLVTSGGAGGPGFLELLAARAPAIRGLGPSTTEAIEHFRTTGRPPAEGGHTNGALMRSLPIGWAMPLDRVEERRASTIELSRMTHPSPDACCAACVGAACAAWAIEGASSALLLDVAREEAAAVAEACGADERIGSMLSAVAAGQWTPSSSGITLDPGDTLASVLWCIRQEPSLPVALVSAVRIGGDTDTIAALVGGLLGCRLPPEQVLSQLPWAADVQMPDGSVVEKLAGGLVDLRSGRAGS